MSAQAPNYEVGISITVVPDGFAPCGRCRLSLQVMPHPKTLAPREHRVDIRCWPLEVARLATAVRIAGGHLDSTTIPADVRPVGYLEHPMASDLSNQLPPEQDPVVLEAQKLWTTIFTTGESDQFKRLIGELAKAGSPSQQDTAASSPIRTEVVDFSGPALASFVKALSSAATAATLVRRSARVEATQTGLVPGQMPLDLLRDANRPGVRWWYGLYDQWVSPPLPSDAGPAADSLVARTSSIEKASAFIRHQAAMSAFWRTAGPDEATATVAREVRGEIARMRRSWALGEEQVQTTVAQECEEVRKGAPMRKFAGILTYPTLAKYFGLIVDVLVDPAQLATLLEKSTSGRRYGALAADFGDMNAVEHRESASWTAVVLGPAVGGGGQYFGPCGTDEARRKAPADDDFFRDGILNLNVQYDGKPRFVVSDIDETQTVLGFEETATQIVAADRAGLQPADQSTRMPPLHGAGLKLTDRSITTQANTVRRDGLVSYACHLMEAFRFDVAMTPRHSGEWRDRGRWRTLVGRSVQFDGLHEDYVAATAPVLHRDEGRVRHAAASRRVKTENGEVDRKTADRDLLVWRGEGLGVPSFHQERQIHDDMPVASDVCVDGRFDLGVAMSFDLPRAIKTKTKRDSRRCAPPLRERRRYILGARACFVNGCGVDFETAAGRYGAFDSAVVLGRTAGEPYCFMRASEIQAPDVLLAWNDRVVTARNPAVETPGETIDTLVIRSGVFATDRAMRLLMPARSSFDASEQAGVFDDERHPHTEGAFAGAVRFRSCDPEGTFPIARGGRIVYPDRQDPVNYYSRKHTRDIEESKRRADSTQSRGTVLVLDPQADPPGRGYHPEPLGGGVCARFCDPGTDIQAASYDSHADPFRFWPPSPDGIREVPSLAKPIALRVQRADDPSNPLLGWFEQTTEEQVPQINGSPLDVNCIAIALKRAADVELELWAHVEISLDCDSHQVLGEAVSLLREEMARAPLAISRLVTGADETTTFATRIDRVLGMTPDGQMDAVAARELDALLCLGPIPQICTRRRVRLVHAVDRPEQPPEFESKSPENKPDLPPRRQFAAVVVTVASETDTREQPAGLRSWSDFVEAQGDLEAIDWPSQANGTTTFFVGRVNLDRASTGALRADAVWSEFEPAGVKRNPRTGRWAFTPRAVPQTTLFSIDRIASSDASAPDAIDLVKEDGFYGAASAHRRLAYSFPDGKARRLTVDLVATSRFTPFFPPAPPRDATEIGPYERNSIRPAHDVWVRATFRPAPPEVDRIMPVFRWSFNVDAPASAPPSKIDPAFGKKLTWRREAGLRLYLKRDSCYSTGEGELLAVAFGPFVDGDKRPLDLCKFEDAVKEFGGFITRWGADPIHESGKLDDLMPYQQLIGGEEIDQLRLPFAYEAIVSEVRSFCVDRLPAGSVISVIGDHFISGASATVNGEPARRVVVLNSMEATVELDKEATCPLQVRLRNPDLLVSIKAFQPVVDPEEGLWYCDLAVQETRSYFPFVQFGLANYQPHCAPDLDLSPPRPAWAQLPPTRQGSVTFNDDRTIVITHEGVGYRRSAPTSDDARLLDTPRLNLRLLRAASPGRVAPDRQGSPAWTPVLDATGQPIQKLHLAPIQKGDELWWAEKMALPPCVPGIRYGLLVEEYELMDADPDPTIHPQRYQRHEGKLTVETSVEERGPLFLHIVDLGE